jgi:hypothetical protein
MIGDFYRDKWTTSPGCVPIPGPYTPHMPSALDWKPNPPATRDDFEQLKKEVLEMKELLKRAIEYDKRNNEPECGNEFKIEFLKKVAEAVGVDLEDVLKTVKKP